MQQQIQSTQMKELEAQLTTVQHEVKQRQLHLQELEEQLKGSQELGAGLQQLVDEYCSSVDKLEEELTITRQKHQIAVEEVIIIMCLCFILYIHMYVCTDMYVLAHAYTCTCTKRCTPHTHVYREALITHFMCP